MTVVMTREKGKTEYSVELRHDGSDPPGRWRAAHKLLPKFGSGERDSFIFRSTPEQYRTFVSELEASEGKRVPMKLPPRTREPVYAAEIATLGPIFTVEFRAEVHPYGVIEVWLEVVLFMGYDILPGLETWCLEQIKTEVRRILRQSVTMPPRLRVVRWTERRR